MAGYICPECGRNAKLPDFCCGSAMVASGTYICPNCKARSTSAGTCECGTSFTQL